ncbi:MAG: uracil-DNA glycosylase [Candidatus Eisenbacteria bacterium]
MTRLAGLERTVKACGKCALAGSRRSVVFGSGDGSAGVMLIGEAPGKREDETGVPFVGQAGKLLDKTLAAAGLAREEIYIANVLKCRPPGNRNPRPEEIEHCRSWLDGQIEIIDPAVLVPMGNFALSLFAPEKTTIGAAHGRRFAYRGRFVIPIYHPAAILYNRRLEPELVEDFRGIAGYARRSGKIAGGKGPPPLS